MALMAAFCFLASDPACSRPPRNADAADPDYEWHPQWAPDGPVTIVVRVPQQRVYVYRNGIRIGFSKASTGKPGHETPLGAFTILEKQREHFSNLYDDAPMPYMQRLTWSGVAMHAGALPGYPASHGCIRLPYEFAEKLFETTTTGTTVIVSGAAVPPVTSMEAPFGASDVGDLQAQAGRSSSPVEGPVVVVASVVEREVVVLARGVEVARAPLTVAGDDWRGTRAYLRLQGEEPVPSSILPDRPALKWLNIELGRDSTTSVDLGTLARSMKVDPAFAEKVYDWLKPGSVLIVTDEPISSGPNATLIFADTSVPAEAALP